MHFLCRVFFSSAISILFCLFYIDQCHSRNFAYGNYQFTDYICIYYTRLCRVVYSLNHNIVIETGQLGEEEKNTFCACLCSMQVQYALLNQ